MCTGGRDEMDVTVDMRGHLLLLGLVTLGMADARVMQLCET